MSDSLRDEGIETAIENSVEQWKAGYERFAAEFYKALSPGDQFTGDQMHRYIESHIDAEPHTPHAKGAMFRIFVVPLLQSGQVVVAGYQKSVRASNRSHYYRVYQRVA